MNMEGKLTKKDFVTPQEVKWCSGCGDFSVLAQTQRVLAEIGRPREDYAFITGIGCSSRFTYYMETYGFHTIHGRALAIASGVKSQNPDLSVWVTIGDGDAVSIGGNHFVHAVKRNLDMVLIIMDNRIYGLTKGQVSPTSEKGKITKTSPYGSIDEPLDPVRLALGAGATFVARTTDRNVGMMRDILHKAYEHKGLSVVHVLQNCVIFNDGAFEREVGKEKSENTLELKHGEPLLFGAEKDKTIVMDGFQPKVVNVAGVDPAQMIKHDAHCTDPTVAMILSSLDPSKFPTPVGLIRQVEKPAYDAELAKMQEQVIASKGKGDLQKLLSSGETWTVS